MGQKMFKVFGFSRFFRGKPKRIGKTTRITTSNYVSGRHFVCFDWKIILFVIKCCFCGNTSNLSADGKICQRQRRKRTYYSTARSLIRFFPCKSFNNTTRLIDHAGRLLLPKQCRSPNRRNLCAPRCDRCDSCTSFEEFVLPTRNTNVFATMTNLPETAGNSNDCYAIVVTDKQYKTVVNRRQTFAGR